MNQLGLYIPVFQLFFFEDNASGERWLDHVAPLVDSNVSPACIPVSGSIFRIGISNEFTASFRLDLYINTVLQSSVTFVSTETEVRNLSPGVPVSAGDSLAVFCATTTAGADDPRNLTATVYMR